MAFSNVTQTSIASEFVPAITDRRIIEEARASVIIAPTITHHSLQGQPGKVLTVPKWPSVSASAVSEATDLSNTAINPTGVPITASEVGIMSTITDLLVESDILGELTGNDGYSLTHARAIADKIDYDIAALFPALAGASAVGTSGTDITLANWLTAIYTLDAANARGPRVGVLHPVQYKHLRSALSVATGVVYGGKEEFSRTGQVDVLFGVPTFQTTNVGAGATSIDWAGAMYVKEALAMLTKWAARTELQRDASLRATELVTVVCYGLAEVMDVFGVSIQTDATA